MGCTCREKASKAVKEIREKARLAIAERRAKMKVKREGRQNA